MKVFMTSLILMKAVTCKWILPYF